MAHRSSRCLVRERKLPETRKETNPDMRLAPSCPVAWFPLGECDSDSGGVTSKYTTGSVPYLCIIPIKCEKHSPLNFLLIQAYPKNKFCHNSNVKTVFYKQVWSEYRFCGLEERSLQIPLKSLTTNYRLFCRV